MRCNYIREKKYQCGDDYMAVGVFSIIPQEHRGRGKKRKESSEGQKAKNKMASLRKRQRKALTNFSPAGMFLTGTYEDPFLPEDILACRRDVENYKRRVMAATCKRFGARREDIRLMLVAVRKGEAGRLHMHGFAECQGLTAAQRREWREMLEDLWRRRIPGSNEFEPLGTMNVNRIDMKKLLGKSVQGEYGTMGYFYGHKERLWVETANLRPAIEQAPTMADGAGNSCGPPAGKSRTMPSGGSSGFPAGRWKSASCWSPAGCMRARSGKEPAGNGWNRNAM